jgi:hypothetical protein
MPSDCQVSMISSSVVRITAAMIFDGPLYRLPALAASFTVIAPVALAIGRSAIHELRDIAAKKIPLGSTKTARDRGAVQSAVAEAEAMIRSARSYFYDALATAWERAVAHEPFTLEHKADLMLASTWAVRTAARAIDFMHRMGGTTGIYTRSRLERLFREPRRCGTTGSSPKAGSKRWAGCTWASGPSFRSWRFEGDRLAPVAAPARPGRFRRRVPRRRRLSTAAVRAVPRYTDSCARRTTRPSRSPPPSLPCLGHDVVNRCLHFLNAGNVVAADHNRQIHEPAAKDFPAVVAEQRDREQPPLARLLECAHQVAGSSARRNRDRDVAAVSVSDQLAEEDRVTPDVVGDGPKINRGRLHRQRKRRNRRRSDPRATSTRSLSSSAALARIEAATWSTMAEVS